jgi:uncharacterized membrane protein YkgB
MTIQDTELAVASWADRNAVRMARVAFFVVYSWFGILKVLGASPAIPLVDDLLAATLPFVSPETFNVLFGAFEAALGVLFLSPRFDQIVIPLFLAHMFTTFLPLVVLPAAAWSAPFVPTLVGQYIIKNVALIALAAIIVARIERK